MKRFLAAAAVAPLCFAALQAHAQTTVTDTRTTPAQTSTTGDLTINAGASIKVTSGTAVTVDSNNVVTNNGTVDVTDSTTPATGILVTSPNGSVISGGVINVTDTEKLKDNDGDGDLDGPFVSATTPRFGIHVLNPFTGAITESSGSILIRGNNSAAISIDNGLTGSLTVRGQNVLVGGNSYGVRVAGPVVGNIDIGGTVSAQGQNSIGLSVENDVTGKVIVGGGVVGTGFRYLTRTLPFKLSNLDSDDLLLGGPGARITGNVSGGVIVNAATANTDDLDPDDDASTPAINDPHPDEDGDGINDVDETAGSITSFGSAPGLLIAAPTAITLGNVGTGLSAYGLDIKGNVVGNGLFDGFSATAVQLGGAGGTVDTSNGVRIGGTVFANASLAGARGLVVDAGATAPEVRVDGSLQSLISSDATHSPDAIALQVNAGGSVTNLINNGAITASISGPTGQATAVQDNAGTIASITNTGSISAGLNRVNATDVITGTAIALDLHNNTGGVAITQTHNTSESVTPAITGDILFGSGNASLTVLEGSVKGDVAFGSGVNSLVIDGTKTTTDTTVTPNTTTTVVNGLVSGKLTNAGQLSVDVSKGSLINTNTAAVALTSLNVGADGILGFTLDPTGAGGASGTQYQVSGAATLADGARLDLVFGSKLSATQTFTLIQAGSLTAINPELLGETPFIYTSSLTTTPNAVNVTIGRRSLTDLGLSGARAAAYDSVFSAFDSDTGVATALFGKTDQQSFAGFYNQLLPDYAGGAFQSLAAASRAVMRAQGEEPAGMETNQRRSWLQEVGFTTRREVNRASDVPYDSAGFGVAGGVEEAMRNGAVRGLSIAYVSSDIDNSNRRGFSKLTASALLGSAYWRKQVGEHLMLNASATAGFTWFDSDRDVIDEDSTGARVLQRQAGAKWEGALGAARFAAVYEIPLGRFYIRPDAFVDYVYLYEDGYREHGGGTAVDLAVDHRTSYESAAEAGITFGGHFGRGFRWDPELRIGYRTMITQGLSETTARFLAGGNPFLMHALGVDQNSLVVRAAIRGGSRYANVALEATGDVGDLYSEYEGRLVVRFIF
ncbi:MAG TPA: autotransporter outer membrane beta-barrel domain-containing protein [Caulobacteraceae bacterium]|nr:autotransporter outer membrane beta-barrel domain-containing protein [Caulobacteraceae bacterium]